MQCGSHNAMVTMYNHDAIHSELHKDLLIMQQ